MTLIEKIHRRFPDRAAFESTPDHPGPGDIVGGVLVLGPEEICAECGRPVSACGRQHYRADVSGIAVDGVTLRGRGHLTSEFIFTGQETLPWW